MFPHHLEGTFGAKRQAWLATREKTFYAHAVILTRP
jgi:hypothetical protein